MKKLITFFIVAVMLVSTLAIGVSAEQSNMDVTIPKFTKQPVFDGCVTPEEWGEKTISVTTDGAATTDDTEVADNGAGLKNYFYWFAAEGFADSLSFDVWLRWDDQYLYLAAIVNDPDPFSLPSGGADIWNGDCLQIRVDEMGPNSIMKKSNPDYDYKVDAYNGNRFSFPWFSDKKTFNSILALVKKETPTQWRCGQADGDNGHSLKDEGGLVGITYVPNDDGETGVITYEAAFPWASVNATFVPKAGDVLGVGIAVACSDSNVLNASLQWGSGTMHTKEQPRGTRGGSQAMILGTDEIAPAEGHALVTEPEETKDLSVSLAPVATGNNNNATEKDGDNKVDDTNKGENKKPANTGISDKDGEGLDTWVWIVIAVAAVAAVAVVVVVIKKKKN